MMESPDQARDDSLAAALSPDKQLAVVPGFAVPAPAAQPTAPRAAQTAETDETDETDETVQTKIAQTLTWFCDRTN